MDNYEKKIQILKQELDSKEKDIRLAATIGQKLLQENEELRKDKEELLSQIEVLKQENHSLQLSVGAKAQSMISHSSEIETLKECISETLEKFEQLKREDALTCRKLQVLQKEHKELQEMHEEVIICNEMLKKQISDLEGQIKDFQKQAHVSFNETFSEDYQNLQNDYAKRTEEIKALQNSLSDLQSELENMKSSESTLLRIVKEVQEELQDKDKELSSYSVIVRKYKEEISELEATVELLKLEQIDVKRRGNSVFGELDDRRLLVEKEYRILKDKHATMEENYGYVAHRYRQTRQQMLTLRSMASHNEDAEYISELENKFHVASNEIRKLNRLLEERAKKEEIPVLEEQKARNARIANGSYEYLRVMLAKSDERIKYMEKDIHEVRRLKVAESDKLADTLRRLNIAEKDNLRLLCVAEKWKAQVQALTNKDIELEKLGEPRIEIIPGFVKKSQNEEKENEVTSTKNGHSDQKELQKEASCVLSEKNPAMSDNSNKVQMPNGEKPVTFQAVDAIQVPQCVDASTSNAIQNIQNSISFNRGRVPRKVTEFSNEDNCTQQ